MTAASDLKRVTTIESVDTVRVEKIRWSIRQRLRKHMLQLSSDFFDELDDFLFAGGQKGQFAEDSVYLKAMREFRAKQGLFEETFITKATSEIKSSFLALQIEQQVSSLSKSTIPSSGLESVEVDIALKAMERKAHKQYAAFMQQIDSIKGQFRNHSHQNLIATDILLTATLSAISAAHSVFQIPLEVRIVFIKLFENHFVMKLEKLFLDIISILNNVNDHDFVDKLYSSSSAFQTQIISQKQSIDRLQKHRSDVAESGAQKAEIVESSVAQLVSALCLQKELPAFIETMVRTTWRSVMFLIGLNKGTTSLEWTEAKHTISMLTAAVSNKLALNQIDRQEIYTQIKQGFALVQIGIAEQREFMTALEKQFETQTESLETCILVPEESVPKTAEKSPEASISPTGEEIIDQEDLDEIAKLLGSAEEESNVRDKDLEELQTDIDQLQNQALVEYLVNGSYEECTLNRTPSTPDLYSLNNNSGFAINRTRLGLAIALQNGELRIPGYKLASHSNQITLLPTSVTRH